MPEVLEEFCNEFSSSDDRESWEIPDLVYTPYILYSHAVPKQIKELEARNQVTKKDLRTKDLSPFYYGDPSSGVWIRLGVVPPHIDELPLITKGILKAKRWRLRRKGNIWVAEKQGVLG